MTAAVTDYLNIDCETMNAYRLPTENKNSEISGKFMRLEPGRNGIWITGSPDLVTITPRWFTI
jgi:phage-related protein